MTDEPLAGTVRLVLGDQFIDAVEGLSPDGWWEQTVTEQPDGSFEVNVTRRSPNAWTAIWHVSTDESSGGNA